MSKVIHFTLGNFAILFVVMLGIFLYGVGYPPIISILLFLLALFIGIIFVWAKYLIKYKGVKLG